MTEPPPSRDAAHRRVLNNNLRDAARNSPELGSSNLRQHLARGFSGRWTRRDWAHVSLFATLGALVAAIVPGFSNTLQSPAHPQRTTMSLSLPPLSLTKQQGQSGDSWQIVSVNRGETFSHLLDRLDVPEDDQQRLLEHPGLKKSLAKLKPGAEMAFDMPVGSDGKPAALRNFRYDRDDSHRVELSLAGDKVAEKVITRPTESRTVVISGKVGNSLYRSARKLGLSGGAIDTLTDDIFKYDIDFNSDVGANDRFSVVVEQLWREGELIKTGPVLAATFTSGGKLYSGFRAIRDGKAEYFTADGRPLKRSFIRMPIPYARISSGFGMRRHPVLGRMRGHMGVDYAASSGTPIMAAGDARVSFVGWKGGYGRTVILDHGRGYSTLYGHMSAFGGIRAGQRIAQGTVIGRVGSTGLATGPHLHYEFRINGVHRNPLSITMPPPEPLSGVQLAAFRAQVGPALARIAKVEHIIYAGDDGTRVASVPTKRRNKKG
ncbi:M23 family metallopeptidase [Luteimonas aquatica]|uniref:M23 family metallopeptidase n=1 Tax=Luteimonas aquatica TaxID=450364 RepID=UPI001F58B600|nr:M23 family metallopeptidase [Luteimonas aquatica]